ncbi:TPA: MFS transporter, partial [Salmonella enterica subsp. diarizonae serovar 61:l,v:z35]
AHLIFSISPVLFSWSRKYHWAQGVFMTLVNGLCTYLGVMLSGWVLDLNTINNVIDWHML